MFLKLLEMITGIFVVVYDGQHALKFTLGRAGKVVGPGVHFKWPIIQSYRVCETKDTTIELEPQTIQLKDDLVYEVGARAVYQIVDLRKALIEVDHLLPGLKNRMVLAVQRVVKAQDRESIRDLPAMVKALLSELAPVEEQWGVKIHELGFSTFSPTPETLEITQLRRLAEEKLALLQYLRREANLSVEAAVALIAGSVVTLPPSRHASPKPQPAPAPQAPVPEEIDELDELFGEGREAEQPKT
jgi:regulator of protease activity HflC (stomatin/prohibitin superfamily)